MSARTRTPVTTRIRVLQISLIIAVGLASFAALTMPIALRPSTQALDVGDVSQNTLQAPRDIEYVSDIRTEEARKAAESAVQPVYTPPDPAIARQQIERLRTTLQYINSVRTNVGMTTDEKKSNLVELSDVRLKLETIDYLVGISDARWEIVQSEALRVLEQVMRRAIYEDKVESTQTGIPSIVSLTLNEQQSALVAELASAFVVPNSFFSEELTIAAQQAARDAVKPIVQTYKAGETIVPAGEIITPADMEAFQQLDMIRPGQRWEDMLGAVSIIVLSAVLVPLYFFRRKRAVVVNDPRSIFVIALVFVVFLVGARLFANRTLAPYGYPLQAAGLLITALFGLEAGLVISIPLCLLAAYGLPNTIDLAPYYLLSSLVGLLVLGPVRRFWGFVRAGIAISLTGLVVLLAYRLPFFTPDLLGVFQFIGVVSFAGFAAASVTLLLQYLLAQTLGLTTAFQLLDISRPDFPLLQFFLRNAPGTYQHSLQVANLAEQAAEKIGADPLLTRVGAQFHDIGKALNPTFFIENQIPGSVNKHHDIAPEESAATIIRHVTDGIQLAKKYRLPGRLHDFILEHHGTLITRYQYNQAMEAANGDVTRVDIENFRYPGPRPNSRETALLMLADATEARARAERPATDDDLRALVRSVIDTVQKFGQLDDTLLTLRDLNLITESFVTTLRGTYHPRIQYPNAKVPDQDSTILATRKEK
ncbi:MAG TPA: HDIG domain-containing protein [Anaerolineales bacterium]|nr:HDIG domain-containing protein [Anaerolineales bacterium]HMV96172.1 HDIG domain-containing protein [Anaerolineales bacterium]HMX19916.1 HDIG domain-containing protein [Anaerolineales bacterium]HMX73988.1 HDIG domain-containing protein [Anaerolineales bacterium]HMZ42548.1 HDIG domain-containing protein [Anaerolineales bacterium]